MDTARAVVFSLQTVPRPDCYPVSNGMAFGKWKLGEEIPICPEIRVCLHRHGWKTVRVWEQWGYFRWVH